MLALKVLLGPCNWQLEPRFTDETRDALPVPGHWQIEECRPRTLLPAQQNSLTLSASADRPDAVRNNPESNLKVCKQDVRR